jgi:hypothetical protein
MQQANPLENSHFACQLLPTMNNSLFLRCFSPFPSSSIYFIPTKSQCQKGNVLPQYANEKAGEFPRNFYGKRAKLVLATILVIL